MDRRFYDVDMQSDLSSGDDTVQALADRAERLGFHGIAVTDYVAGRDEVAEVEEAVSGVESPVDVHVGATIRPADPGDLKEMLPGIRERVDVLVVHGGDAAVNRAATGDTRVDVLAHPELERNDSGIDHVMAEQAAKNRVAIQVNVRQLLETYGKVRSHVLAHMRRNVRLAEKFDAPVVASSGATAVGHLRAPRELAAFPRILGMDVGASFETVSDVPRRMLKRAERIREEGFVRPGVTVEDDGGGRGG